MRKDGNGKQARDDEQRASEAPEVTNHKSEPLDRWRLYTVDAFGCKRKARDVSCGIGVAHEVAELQNHLGERWGPWWKRVRGFSIARILGVRGHIIGAAKKLLAPSKIKTFLNPYIYAQPLLDHSSQRMIQGGWVADTSQVY